MTYGFAYRGLSSPELSSASTEAPLGTIQVEQRLMRANGDGGRVSIVHEDRADIELPPDRGRLLLDRARRAATYMVHEPYEPSELAHPALTPAAAVFARWAGAHAFHAGAFVAGEGAWVLVGDSRDGKSTLLALLHSMGYPVLADDLVVVKDGAALAGARCIDLRPDAADRLGLAASTRPVRSATRRRIDLPPVAMTTAVRGLVYLRWGDDARAVPLPPRRRVAELARAQVVRRLPIDHASLLGLVALPSFELYRPRRWGAADRSVAELLEVVSAP